MRTPEQIFMDALGERHEKLSVEAHAFVLPYNVSNTYHEKILPGTFADQAANWWPIMALVDHEERMMGMWLQARDTPEGLYVYGRLFVKNAVDPEMIRDMEEAHISINYMSPGKLRPDRANTKSIFGMKLVDYTPQIVDQAIISEISLVSEAAFPGTWLKIGRPDWAK